MTSCEPALCGRLRAATGRWLRLSLRGGGRSLQQGCAPWPPPCGRPPALTGSLSPTTWRARHSGRARPATSALCTPPSAPWRCTSRGRSRPCGAMTAPGP
eukprot:9154461-Lingulodinium_polyedra.AAC.1